VDDDNAFGELRAYFDPKQWVVKTHGWIYTDYQWIKDFRIGLLAIGFTKTAVDDIDYSE